MKDTALPYVDDGLELDTSKFVLAAVACKPTASPALPGIVVCTDGGAAIPDGTALAAPALEVLTDSAAETGKATQADAGAADSLGAPLVTAIAGAAALCEFAQALVPATFLEASLQGRSFDVGPFFSLDGAPLCVAAVAAVESGAEIASDPVPSGAGQIRNAGLPEGVAGDETVLESAGALPGVGEVEEP